MTSGVCWGIGAGFLEEEASGGKLWIQGHSQQRSLGCFAQRPVEASWGRRAWDMGAGI